MLFGQVWPGAVLGRGAEEGRLHFERDTTVIVGPAQDACVCVGTRLLYHVRHPNRLFFQDVSAHGVAARADAAAYEGRDDATTEAVDIGSRHPDATERLLLEVIGLVAYCSEHGQDRVCSGNLEEVEARGAWVCRTWRALGRHRQAKLAAPELPLKRISCRAACAPAPAVPAA